MAPRFVTGNSGKFKEAKEIISELVQLDIDLPEIQDTDPRKVIEAKLQEALKHYNGELVIEDTSVYFDCLGGILPGPLIKSFSELGLNNLADLVHRYDNHRAVAKTIIGYAKSPDQIYYFEGTVEGEIIIPTGESSFGWDPIFKPKGYDVSFEQMSMEDKLKISMRGEAFRKLRDFRINN